MHVKSELLFFKSRVHIACCKKLFIPISHVHISKCTLIATQREGNYVFGSLPTPSSFPERDDYPVPRPDKGSQTHSAFFNCRI